MKFEWDFRKAELNRLKHGIEFEDALRVFSDPNTIYGTDHRNSESEWRLFAIGRSTDRLLFVVFVEKPGTIRIISARPADRAHHLEYEKQFS